MVAKAVEDSCRRNGIDRVTAEELEKNPRTDADTQDFRSGARRAERSGAQGPREWSEPKGARGKRRVFEAIFPRTE